MDAHRSSSWLVSPLPLELILTSFWLWDPRLRLQIYNHVAAGFSDGNPYLRELTLKSLAVLGPKLSQKTLNQSLLKHLAKLQVRPEGEDALVGRAILSVCHCLLVSSRLKVHGHRQCGLPAVRPPHSPAACHHVHRPGLPRLVPCPGQVDEEASIRANTTVLLGNLASHLSGELDQIKLIMAGTFMSMPCQPGS